MPESRVAPYGSWKSPITSDLIVGGSIGLTSPLIDGPNVYWVEMRPTEGGRGVIVRRGADGVLTDVIPPPFNARTRVHEYGGGEYAVRDGEGYFSNFTDQRIYRVKGDAEPQAITPAVAMRYADATFDRLRRGLICVREDHTLANHEPANTLVNIDLDGNESTGKILVAGNDFYSSPRISHDGSRLAWLTWNHPNMPWDGTELWVADFTADGKLANATRVAGGPRESIFQPEWSPEGALYFVSDRSGWWNLYRIQVGGDAEPVCEMQAEFGMPQWAFGMSSYAFESPNRIVCSYIENGFARLALIDTQTKTLERLDCPYTDIRYLRASPGEAVMRAGSPTQSPSIVKLDLNTRSFSVLRRSSDLKIDSAYLSAPRALAFPTENGLEAHGFFYPPKNDDFPRARRRATAAVGANPRRTHLSRSYGVESFHSILDQPWHCRA